MFNFFKKRPSSFLGIDIDIGTTGIRMVQLGLKERRVKLENYASLESKDYLKVSNDTKRSGSIEMLDAKIVVDLKKIIEKAEITARDVAMSVPASSAFSSIINLPDIPDNEISKAVDFEARQYIPIPIEEVVFDWSIVSRETNKDGNVNDVGDAGWSKRVKVLLVAIPKEITNKYANIAKSLKLNLVALETEPFSLSRSLVSHDKGVFAVIDIGSKTTNITIVENGSVLTSHSIFGTGGNEITKVISRGLNIDFRRAEALKKDVGLKFSDSERKVSEIILPIIGIIISEIRKVNETYYRDSKRKVGKVIITGGSTNIPGLVEYLSQELNMEVEVGNPWKNIVYDEALSEELRKTSSYFSVAVGLALRGFEN
jgi:type IV pilus assembly protein PilM